MNWIDWIIILIFFVFAFEAIGRPFLLEMLDFVSFSLSFFVSFSYYNFAAKQIETGFHIPHTLALVLGFSAMWFITEVVFYLVIAILRPKLPKLNIPLEKFLAIIPAVSRALIFIALSLVILATFPIQPVVKKAVLDSKIGSQILKNAYALEQPVKNVFGGISNDTLTFLTIKPKTDEAVDLGFKTTEVSIDEQSEKIMISLVNQERVDRGLDILIFDSGLQDVAREHSKDMFKRGYFSHYSPEGKTVANRVSEVGIDFLVVGENLAYTPNVETAHKGLMNSEGHRANILSVDYGKIGIGVIDGGLYGKMFTQVFSN